VDDAGHPGLIGGVDGTLASALAALKCRQWCSKWPGMPQKLQPCHSFMAVTGPQQIACDIDH
jgi:hypothetical protein